MGYWKITPFHSNDVDCCVMPAETELDHQAALTYAQEILESAWDQLKPGMQATVTIERCEGDIPASDVKLRGDQRREEL